MFDSIPDNLPIANTTVPEQNTAPVEAPKPVQPVVNNPPVQPAPKATPDIFDYVPLDEETKTSVNWKRWVLIILAIIVIGFAGWVVWFGSIPFVNKVVYNPPWQLSADKTAQYIINDLLKSEHVKISAVLTSERFKVILDDQVPQITDVKADIKADVNFSTPFDSEIKMDVEHDGQNRSNFDYQVVRGQSYLTGLSAFDILAQMFNTSGNAMISLPQQTSQPSLTFAEVKDIYALHKFLIASDLERSVIDGQEYAMVTLKSDANTYQEFVQAIRDKKGVGLPYASNLDMIFSPQTTIKAAVRLSDKTFRNAFIEGTHSRLGNYKLSITIDALDDKVIKLSPPESIITTKAALEVPQPVEVDQTAIPEALRDLINNQPEAIKKLIGSNPQVPTDFPTDYTLDSDSDGIPDAIEILIGTLPNKADSDGDGYGDLQEIERGYNPLGEGKLEFPEPVEAFTPTTTIN